MMCLWKASWKDTTLLYKYRLEQKIVPYLKFLPQFFLAKWPADAQPMGPGGTFSPNLAPFILPDPVVRLFVVPTRPAT